MAKLGGWASHISQGTHCYATVCGATVQQVGTSKLLGRIKYNSKSFLSFSISRYF